MNRIKTKHTQSKLMSKDRMFTTKDHHVVFTASDFYIWGFSFCNQINFIKLSHFTQSKFLITKKTRFG